MPRPTELRRPSLRLQELRRPPRIDVLVAAFFVVLTVAEAFTNPDARPPWGVALAVVAAAALALRRQLPIAVAVLVVAVNLVTNPQDELSTLLSLVLVSFSVGFECDPPRNGVGLAVVLGPFMAVQLFGGDFVPSDLAAGAIFVGGPWGVGAATRQRTRQAAEAMARAEILAREEQERAERAVLEERTRIARELHDVVSHSISVVTIQTQAVRRRLDPAQEREIEDLRRIEATARDAMAEMRRLFGVLRTSGTEQAALAPQPGLLDLPSLVERTDSPETRVHLEIRGAPLPVPPGLDLAAYRVAQEALTNAVKHAGARRVDVVLTWTAHDLTVRVADDGRGAAGLHGDGAGQGIAGMRERVALYGGEVAVTTRPGQGFAVEARLPLKEAR